MIIIPSIIAGRAIAATIVGEAVVTTLAVTTAGAVDWNLLITASATAIPATIFALAAWRAAGRAEAQAKETQVQAKETHDIVNSRMSEMRDIIRKEATAEATLAEKEAEHVRKGEAAVAKTATTRRSTDKAATGGDGQC